MVWVNFRGIIGRTIPVDVKEGQTVDLWDMVMQAIETEELFEDTSQSEWSSKQRYQENMAMAASMAAMQQRGPREVQTSQQSAQLFDIIVDAVNTQDNLRNQGQSPTLEFPMTQKRSEPTELTIDFLRSLQGKLESRADKPRADRQGSEVYVSPQPRPEARASEPRPSKPVPTEAKRSSKTAMRKNKQLQGDVCAGSPKQITGRSREERLRGAAAPPPPPPPPPPPRPRQPAEVQPLDMSAVKHGEPVRSQPMQASPQASEALGIPAFPYIQANPTQSTNLSMPEAKPKQSANLSMPEDAQSDDSSEDLLDHPIITAIVGDGLDLDLGAWFREKCSCIRTPENRRSIKIRANRQATS